jgi:hypothetical protein
MVRERKEGQWGEGREGESVREDTPEYMAWYSHSVQIDGHQVESWLTTLSQTRGTTNTQNRP